MDLDEWEILPRCSGFLDYHEGDLDGNKGFVSASKRGFDMNYFVCPSSPPKSSRIVPSQQLVPVPIELESTGNDHEEGDSPADDIKDVPSMLILPEVKDPDKTAKKADQDQISQVFFKKMKENNQFVDMKMDSPESPTKIFLPPPQIDAAKFNFEDQESEKADNLEIEIRSPRIESEKEKNLQVQEVKWEENSGGLRLWKWSLNGIGAICSFGMAAATVCIIILGSHQKNKHQQQNQKLRFQIYTDDKRIKQVVQHAARLNGAITAVSGVPVARAHITYGGYYEGL